MRKTKKAACWVLIAWCFVGLAMRSQAQDCPDQSVDQDRDCILDSFEQTLLDTFAPVFNSDQGCPSTWQSGVPVPVEPSWFLRNGFVRLGTSVVAISPSLNEFVNTISTHPNASSMNIGFNISSGRWGDSQVPGDRTSWAQAAATGAGIFGRVWRPWPEFPTLYSVQYFMFLTANQNISTCIGYHDGDWIGVDFGVETGWPGRGPFIRHAVYHVHGKQLLLTRESLEFENGHPVVYLEPGVGEAWPNRSNASGYDSWPSTFGFAKNWIWDEFGGIVNEENVSVRHGGNGCRYLSNAARPIRNLGELGLPIGSDLECRAVMSFPGVWGSEAGGCPFDFDSEPPRSPPYYTKMWSRVFTYRGGDYDPLIASPLSRDESPIFPDIDRTMRSATSRYGGCGGGIRGYLYSRCGYFLPIAYAWPSHPTPAPAWGGDGRRENPCRTLSEGIGFVAEFGVLRIGSGNYPGPYSLSKPMIVQGYNGVVTIGQ